MSNVIKFPQFDRIEIKEVYTWMQLLFADSSDERSVHIELYSFGGDGEWHFLPIATIEEMESNKVYIYFYDVENDSFFVDAWWDMEEDGVWFDEKEAHIEKVIENVNINNYHVACKQMFSD